LNPVRLPIPPHWQRSGRIISTSFKPSTPNLVFFRDNRRISVLKEQAVQDSINLLKNKEFS